MLLQSLTPDALLRRKNNLRIYKAPAGTIDCIWKCCPMSRPDLVEALRDEYETIRNIHHPSVPAYLGHWDLCAIGDSDQLWSVVCMEKCPGQPIKQLLSGMSNRLILTILRDTGRLLSLLLSSGVIYTDLNLTNLLLHSSPGVSRLYLVDYTCSYYFLRNPDPSYPLCFSYDLSPDLKGQQLLVQELSFLFEDMLKTRGNEKKDSELSSSVFSLYEAGKNPSPSLSLGDYICQIDHCMDSLA